MLEFIGLICVLNSLPEYHVQVEIIVIIVVIIIERSGWHIMERVVVVAVVRVLFWLSFSRNALSKFDRNM